MKKRIIIVLSVVLLIVSILCIVYVVYSSSVEMKIDTNDKNIVNVLIDKYNNDEIVGVLEIPDVLKTVVVKHSDNDYYLTHNIKRQKSELGAVFMDYRVNPDDKKVLIYGHNSTRGNRLPFVELDKYVNKSFYDKHKVIYLYTKDGKMTFDIFSAYVESSDFDYVNIDDYNGLTYLEHINKLKNKSNYDTNITLNKDSKIIILQTCNVESGYDGSMKNTLVMGVLR